MNVPPKILLVEDNPDDVQFLRRAFTKVGLTCDLRVAQDGQQALDQLSTPGAATHVLLDLKLPLKSGLEVLAWIRGHASLSGLPVIVLTSSEVRSDVDHARSLGVDAYLVKPLTSLGLLETARRIADCWKLSVAASKPA